MLTKICIWKHKEWETFPGTWGIYAHSDEEIISLIKSNPEKYGIFEDWYKAEK
ncbi:MAG TPA: hypothetical protein VI432_00055 [Candidatus Paceibacterota bacterium]